MTGSREVVLVVDVVRPEEKMLWHSLSALNLKPKILNVNQVPLKMTECPGEIALIRPVSMFKAVYAAAALEAGGCRCINSSFSILYAGDKILSLTTLMRHGLPVVESVIAMHPQAALQVLLSQKKPVIDKPPIGSWGRMVSLVKDSETAKMVVEHREAIPASQARIHIIQEYIDTGREDIRCFVVAGECLGCVKRIASDIEWRANVALGGRVEPLGEGVEELCELAIRAAGALKAFYAAVDILKPKGASTVLINEINGVPEFKAFQKATGIDVARALAEKVFEEFR